MDEQKIERYVVQAGMTQGLATFVNGRLTRKETCGLFHSLTGFGIVPFKSFLAKRYPGHTIVKIV